MGTGMEKCFYGKWYGICLVITVGICLAMCGLGRPAYAREGQANYTVTATPIYYGQKLGASVLTGEVKKTDGTVLKGTLAWQNPEEVMLSAGTFLKTAVFTPEGAATPVKDASGKQTGTSEPGGTVAVENESAEVKNTDAETAPDHNSAPDSRLVYLNVSVQVNPAVLTVEEWPAVGKKQNIYDGDVLRDAVLLEGGGPVTCQVDRPAPNHTEQVNGKFRWKTPGKIMETGTCTAEIVFEPANTANYESCSTEIEIKVKPRPVALQIRVSDRLVKVGQELLLTAVAGKDDKTGAPNGKISFLVNGETVASGLIPAETEEGFRAEAAWSAEEAGDYEVWAVYIPRDNHTDRVESGKTQILAAAPVSAFVTEELPEGKEGKEYEAVLETDASGRFEIKYSVTQGRLPNGLSFNEKNGKISGIPKETGKFTFTAEAAEEGAKIYGIYTVTVREKEKLAFSVICKDVCYGEKVEAQVRAERNSQLRYRITYEGIASTKYEKRETPPAMPGDYRVKAIIEEPEDFAGQEVFQDFSVRKARPKLAVLADPQRLTGAGDITLKIMVENPVDAGLKEGLPTVFSVSFDSAVKTRQSLEGKEGVYTYVFTTENRNGKIRCTVKSRENDFYETAESYVDVETRRKEEPEVKPSEKPKEENRKEEPEKEKEPVRKSPEEMEAEFWQDVIFRIYDAQEKGDTVTINAKGRKSMPDRVMDALRGHDKVTLALVWEGDMIIIPPGKAPQFQKGRTEWTLTELSKQYPLSKPAASVPPVPQTPPQGKPQESALAPSESIKPSVGDGQKAEADKGGVIVHEKTEDRETEAPCEDEDDSGREESSVEPERESAAAIPESTVQVNGEAGRTLHIDWFLAAAFVCAGTGVIAVAVAIAAMVKKKK